MPFVGLGAIVLAALTPFIGTSVNGAIRSIDIMGVSVQAAEPCKLGSAMALAYFLSRFQNPDGSGLSSKGVWIGLGIIVLFVGLLITQGGSNALLVLLVGGTMMILSVLPRKLIIGGLITLVVAIGVAVAVFSYVPSEKETASTTTTTEVVKTNKRTSKYLSRFTTWKIV